jgi:RimJ/RimL family protein N-acetyltransferase
VPLDAAAHASDLWAAYALDRDGRNWTYLSVGPFVDLAAYTAWVASVATAEDPLYFAVVEPVNGRAVGVLSLMRIDPSNGVIEVGGLNFSPLMQRKPAATEAIYLVMRYAFDLGYRRFEWKCDSLNEPSRRAAARFGFQYEGRFRQAVVYKGRNRDTDWYSILDNEWPMIRRAFEAWLAPSNFTSTGDQRVALAALMAKATGEGRAHG